MMKRNKIKWSSTIAYSVLFIFKGNVMLNVQLIFDNAAGDHIRCKQQIFEKQNAV